MATSLTAETQAPTGLYARSYNGAGGSNTYVYWVQAIYPWGKSVAAQSNTLTNVNSPTNPGGISVEWNAMVGAIGYLVYRTTSVTPPTVSGYMAAVSGNNFSDMGLITPATASLVVADGLRFAQARYDFALDTGAIALLTLANSDTIPANAIVYGGVVNSTTALVGSGGSVSIGTTAGSSAASILAVTAITSLTLDAVLKSTATATPFKMTSAGTVTLTPSTTALTAGVIDIIVYYSMPVSA